MTPAAVHATINAQHIYRREAPGCDVWQTPAEFTVSAAGDCEDFAIAYWHALRACPGPAYIAWCRRADAGGPQAHMVCLYYPPGSTDPLVLDVAADAVCALSDRFDLAVVFEFDAHGLYLGAAMRPVSQLTPWADVLARMAQQEAA